MSAAHELPALVTVDDAAKALSLHPDHVRRLVRAGELVGYRLGRAVRVEADSVRVASLTTALLDAVAASDPRPSRVQRVRRRRTRGREKDRAERNRRGPVKKDRRGLAIAH